MRRTGSLSLAIIVLCLLGMAGSAIAQTCPNPIDTTSFFVRQQYLDFLGRQPTTSELNNGINQINICGTNQTCIARARVLFSRQFWDHPSFRAQSRTFGLGLFSPPHQYDNWDFVALSYYVYLQRAPNDPPDNDFSGHAFWLADLNNCTGPEDGGDRDTTECYNHIIEAFLVSIEYRARFGCT